MNNENKTRKTLFYWLGAIAVVVGATVGVIGYFRGPIDANAKSISGLESRQDVDDQRYTDIDRRLGGLEEGQQIISSDIKQILRILR